MKVKALKGGPLPENKDDCMAERAQLIAECREVLNGAKSEGRDLSGEETQIHTEKMNRCKALFDKANNIDADATKKRQNKLIQDFELVEQDLDQPHGNRITSPEGGAENRQGSILNANGMPFRGFHDNPEGGTKPTDAMARMSWNLKNKTRNGEAAQRNVYIGGRRTTDEYRCWARQRLVGNAREVLGPNGQPVNLMTTIQTGDDVRAGYFVIPEQMTAEILKNVDDDVFIQQWARVTYLRKARSAGMRRRTAKANSFNWGAELSDATDNLENTLAYGKRVLMPHYLTGAFRISRDLLEMSEINIEQEVISEMMIDLREFLEVAYFLGSGVQRPLGLLVASADGISTGRDISFGTTATTYGFNTLIKAKYTMKDKYLRNGAFLVMHPDRVADLAMLRDDSGATVNTGTYLWVPSRTAGEPDVACGIPIRQSYFMPNATGSGSYFGLLGDFSYYRIVIGMELEMQLLKEMRARTNENEYLFRMKVDAAPVLEEAFLRLKFA